jgi:hypothetical protein
MSSTVDKVSQIIWNISQDAFDDGRKQERERIIEMLEGVRGENSWDFESQIEAIIEHLKEEK